jgi:hypothetical protein
MASETTKKGELACIKFEQRALEKGYVVSRPVLECEYDRVVEIEKKLYRVQIKYAACKSSNSDGAVQANIGKAGLKHGSHKPYDSCDIDAMVVYIPSIDKLCWFDKDVWVCRRMLNIRYKASKNNQTKGCWMAENYFW